MKKRSPRSSETISPAASLAKAVQSELRRQGCYGGGVREAPPAPSSLPSVSALPIAATGGTNASEITPRTVVPPPIMEPPIRPWTASELQMDQVKVKKSWWRELANMCASDLEFLLKIGTYVFAGYLAIVGLRTLFDWLFV
jgi:hypothetical protein